MLQIIDAKDRIAADTSLDSFIFGFSLAWDLAMELNDHKDERLAPQQAGETDARFACRMEEIGF